MSALAEALFAVTTLTAIVAAVVSGFWKLLLDRELTRIKAQFSGEVERLKSALSQDKETLLLVYKNQFEVEFNTYQEIWSALQESQIAIAALHLSRTTDEEKRREAHKHFERLHERNYVLFEKKRPFYSADIYKLLMKHHQLAWDQCRIAERQVPERPLPQQKFELQFAADKKASEAFYESYHAIAESIRSRIHSMRVVA